MSSPDVKTVPAPISTPNDLESPSDRLPANRRVWWLIVVLLVLINGVAWKRASIANWFSGLAESKLIQGDYDAAERWLGYAERIYPQAPMVELRRAKLARLQGDFDDSRNHLQRAKYAGADVGALEREEILNLAQSGRMGIAEPELGKLLNQAQGEEPEICLAYALGFIRVRNFPAALTLLDAWVRDYPTDPRAHLWQGQVFAELQRTQEAEKSFRAALSLQPNNAVAALGLGQLLANAKQTEAALPFLQIAVPSDETGAAAATGLAAAYQSLSRSAEAGQVLKDALVRFPEDHRLLVELANWLIEQGLYKEAAAKLQPTIDAGTLRREIRYAYAVALRGLGRIDEATPHFEYAAEAAQQLAAVNAKAASVANAPENAALRLEIGAVHLKYGNSEDGLTWIHSALELDPGLRDAHRLLAEYYQVLGMREPRFLSLAQRHRTMAGPVALPGPVAAPPH